MKQKARKKRDKNSIFNKILDLFVGYVDLDEIDFDKYNFDYDSEVLHNSEKENKKVIKPVKKKVKAEQVSKVDVEENVIPVVDNNDTEIEEKTSEITERVGEEENDYWSSGFESNFDGEEKESSEQVIPSVDDDASESIDNEASTNNEDSENKANNENNHNLITIKGVVIFAASVGIVVAAGYAVANRNQNVEVTNSAIIESIKSETKIDEVFDVYSSDASNYIVMDADETIDTVLSGESNIVSAVDKMVDLIDISNELGDYDLDKALALNGDIRSLTNAEKDQIRNMSRFDLLTIMDMFKEMGDVDIQAFDKKSVDYSYLTMKLSFAKYIIDNQIMKYGTDILSTYPELIIQAIIIDESGFDTKDYADVDVRLINGKYYACYKAEDNGSQYNVLLDSKAIKLIKDKEYFDGYTSENVNFNDFKEKALETINDCKVMLLTDCEIKHSGPIENTKYQLKTSSNYKVFKKADTFK